MHAMLRVHVSDRVQDRLDVLLDLILRVDGGVGAEALHELAAGGELGHEVKLPWRLVRREQPYDVRVPQRSQLHTCAGIARSALSVSISSKHL